MLGTTLLIHVNTGSIDTYDNWECEALSNGWDFMECLANKSLVVFNEGK